MLASLANQRASEEQRTFKFELLQFFIALNQLMANNSPELIGAQTSALKV